jgi:translation initiation factor IF-3
VVFKGRQMGSKKFGYSVLERITKELEGTISIDMEPKFLGRHLAMVISPLKKRAHKTRNKNEEKQTKD